MAILSDDLVAYFNNKFASNPSGAAESIKTIAAAHEITVKVY